ncbi:MAG: hypothetical protein JO336_13350 [Acidobacteriia bacterium]|nr:hypothetical protein [Terriglobia bacterium]MBV8904536.1 hypothetical protein [Terriglobia bacterium]
MDNLERLIMDLKESFEREIGRLERKMDDGFASINARFDTQATRLDRHAAYWQTGRRWSGKMEEWAEHVDKALEAKDREIADLRSRINRLEQTRPNGRP